VSARASTNATPRRPAFIETMHDDEGWNQGYRGRDHDASEPGERSKMFTAAQAVCRLCARRGRR
jgi:hypothetical protein